MDWEFDTQHVLEVISQRGLSYVVPKRMQTSEKAQAKRLLQRDQERYESDRELHRCWSAAHLVAGARHPIR